MQLPNLSLLLLSSLYSSLVAAKTTGRYSWHIGKYQREVLVKLDTPGYPLWTWNEISTSYDASESLFQSAVLLNFTLLSDNTALFVNNEPYLRLPLQDVSALARISALQIPSSLTHQHEILQRDLPTWGKVQTYLEDHKCRRLGLSYDRLITNRDDPSIRYYNPVFEVRLDIIGLSVVDDEEVERMVSTDSKGQAYVQIRIEHDGSGATDDPATRYKFTRLNVVNRDGGYQAIVPPSEDRCSLWSYRCADIGDPPWWRYIWRGQFDEYGRVGSRRHWIVREWRQMGLRDMVLGVVVTCMCFFQVSRMVLKVYRVVSPYLSGERDEFARISNKKSAQGRRDEPVPLLPKAR